MNRSTTPPPPNADLPSPGEVYRMFFHDSSAIEAVSGDPEPLSSIMDCSFIVACCDGIGLFREMNKREGPMDAVGQRPQPPFRSEDSRSNGNGDGFEGVNEAPALHGSITQPTIDAGLPRRGSRLALEDATMMRFAHSSASTPTPTPTSSSLETPPTPSHFANWIPPYYDPAHSYPPTSSGSATSSLYSESAISQGFTDEMTTLMDRSTFSEFWSLPDPFHGPVVPPSLTVADRQSPSVTHPLSWAAAPLAETGLWAPPSAAQKGQGADEGQTAQVRGGRGGSHGRKRSATRSKSGTKRRSATGQKDSDQYPHQCLTCSQRFTRSHDLDPAAETRQCHALEREALFLFSMQNALQPQGQAHGAYQEEVRMQCCRISMKRPVKMTEDRFVAMIDGLH